MLGLQTSTLCLCMTMKLIHCLKGGVLWLHRSYAHLFVFPYSFSHSTGVSNGLIMSCTCPEKFLKLPVQHQIGEDFWSRDCGDAF